MDKGWVHHTHISYTFDGVLFVVVDSTETLTLIRRTRSVLGETTTNPEVGTLTASTPNKASPRPYPASQRMMTSRSN